MGIRSSARYKKAYAIVAIVAPLAMGLAGYFYGDVEPIVRDACTALLPKGHVIRPSVTVDAGVPPASR